MNKIKCFISYSHYDPNIVKFNKINDLLTENSSYINFSEKEDKSHYTDQTIWNYIHTRVASSSCTILLLTEDLMSFNSYKISPGNNFKQSWWIYKELSTSLRDWKDQRINGLICVMEDSIWYRYFFQHKTLYRTKLPEILELNKDYIIFAKYSQFLLNHNSYINQAKIKREEQINYNKYNIIYDIHNNKYW